MCERGKIKIMNSNIVYPIIIIINIFCGVGLLLGVFTDPFEFLSPYFKGEIEDELILFAQSIVNVTAVHQIAIGLFISVLWKSKLDNESNKKVFLAYSVFGGTVLYGRGATYPNTYSYNFCYTFKFLQFKIL